MFKGTYDLEISMEYRFDDADRAAYHQAIDLGMTYDQIQTAIKAFFAPTSWHRRKNIVRFKNFVNQAQKYALEGQGSVTATDTDKARYYEPWDERHPYRSPDPIIRKQQQDSYEAEHGIWKPKPNWTPGAK